MSLMLKEQKGYIREEKSEIVDPCKTEKEEMKNNTMRRENRDGKERTWMTGKKNEIASFVSCRENSRRVLSVLYFFFSPFFSTFPSIPSFSSSPRLL